MISKYLKKSELSFKIDSLFSNEDLNFNQGPCWGLKEQKNINTYYKVDNYFSDLEISNIIHFSNKLSKNLGTIGGGDKNKIDKKYRMSEISWIPINDISMWIYQKMTKLVNEVNENFYEFDLVSLENLQFTIYDSRSCGRYKKHLDCGSNMSIDRDRKLSMVIQLSDPNEHTGGDLVLYMNETPTIIEKKKGRIVFFPSHVLHEVTPVTSGTRMSLVGWISGPRLK